MNKVALLIVYNHRYDKNIPLLEEIYKGKFSHIFHIMPFYDGNQENVIPVYESSYYFAGYIAQAYTHLKNKGFTHFFVVADDMIINPAITEENLWDVIGIDEDDCLLPSKLIIFQTQKRFWTHTFCAIKYKTKNKRKTGAEINNIVPSVEEAEKQFDSFSIPYSNIPITNIINMSLLRNWRQFISGFKRYFDYSLIRGFFHSFFKRKIQYPLVGGYSDIFLVTRNVMPKFCQYCGAFSANKLWVEIAIPTSLVLSTTKLKFDRDINLHGTALWGDKRRGMMEKEDKSVRNLIASFPKENLFLHPVKLSQWKM